MTATLIRAALGLAERGLRVFPCLPRGKEPAVAKGLLAATTDQNVIKGWWRGNSDCNIGLATGAGSGVFVVDVDGANAEAMLRELEERHSALPATVEAITGRGRHLYFRWLDGMEVRNSAGRIAAGIDVRGEGGYVLAPPSVHPSGRRYCWSVDSADSFAAAPKWQVRNSAGRIAAGIDVRGEGGYVLAPPSVHPSGRRYCWSVDSADSFAAAPKWLLETLVPRGPANKHGNQVETNTRDSAIVLSFALQHGADIESICKALCRDSHGRVLAVSSVPRSIGWVNLKE